MRLMFIVLFPHEIVVSFLNPQPALISAIRLTALSERSTAPEKVEVWTSVEGPDKGFRQVTVATLKESPPEQEISFSSTSAAYVRLRIVSTFSGEAPTGIIGAGGERSSSASAAPRSYLRDSSG